jgi:hypothetical protein
VLEIREIPEPEPKVGHAVIQVKAFGISHAEMHMRKGEWADGTFVTTVTIIPFMPDGWDAAAGFPAMKGNVAFLMKDVVLLAVSAYLLKQDVVRASPPEAGPREWREVGGPRARAAGQVAAKR